MKESLKKICSSQLSRKSISQKPTPFHDDNIQQTRNRRGLTQQDKEHL